MPDLFCIQAKICLQCGHLLQGQLNTDVDELEKKATELERKITLLQSDISSLKREQLVPLAENHAQLEVEKVIAIDLQVRDFH